MTDIEAAPTTILFATDGTSASRIARAAAANLARESGAALHVVHVWSPASAMSGAPGVDEGIAVGVATSEAQLIKETLGCPVAAVHTPIGSRAHGILACAAAVGAGLIVVGGRRLGIVEELFTYRVSEDLVHHSYRPVLLAREDGSAWPPRHIVVGCDGSPEAVRAASLAGWVAAVSGADVTLVAVNTAPLDGEAGTGDAERALEAASRALDGTTFTTRVVRTTDVAKALREACTSLTGSALLAIGARGSSALHRVPQFSVSRSVTHHTHLPLLLVPPTAPHSGDLRG